MSDLENTQKPKQTNLDRLMDIHERRAKCHHLLYNTDDTIFLEICRHCKKRKNGWKDCKNKHEEFRSVFNYDECVNGTMEWLEQEAIDCEKVNTNEREKE